MAKYRIYNHLGDKLLDFECTCEKQALDHALLICPFPIVKRHIAKTIPYHCETTLDVGTKIRSTPMINLGSS